MEREFGGGRKVEKEQEEIGNAHGAGNVPEISYFSGDAHAVSQGTYVGLLKTIGSQARSVFYQHSN